MSPTRPKPPAPPPEALVRQLSERLTGSDKRRGCDYFSRWFSWVHLVDKGLHITARVLRTVGPGSNAQLRSLAGYRAAGALTDFLRQRDVLTVRVLDRAAEQAAGVLDCHVRRA